MLQLAGGAVTRLYLVDDHQIMREGLRAMLTAQGHSVVGESADSTVALADLVRLALRHGLIDANQR